MHVGAPAFAEERPPIRAIQVKVHESSVRIEGPISRSESSARHSRRGSRAGTCHEPPQLELVEPVHRGNSVVVAGEERNR